MHIIKRSAIKSKGGSLEEFFRSNNVLYPGSQFWTSLAGEWPASMMTVKIGNPLHEKNILITSVAAGSTRNAESMESLLTILHIQTGAQT